MKRFITKRTIKIPRYKLFYKLFFFSIVIILFIELFCSFVFRYIDSDSFLSLVVRNSYGNILRDNKFYQKDFFYKNVYGFNFFKDKDKDVVQEEQNISELVIDANPIVYIYNTFQTDKYYQDYYSSYSISPVITQASLILQEYLKEKGIKSFVETESVVKVLKENNLSYSLSYRGSRILLEKRKKENPSLEYFIDLGMSDDNYEATTTTIEKEAYARILFIVGTDNRDYEKNKEFAIYLHGKLESAYPNLSRGVSLRGGAGYHGVYNQDFSPNSLLIYVGGSENRLSEVNRSLKVLADILSQYIGEFYEKE